MFRKYKSNEVEILQRVLNNRDCFVPSIVQSMDLVNAAHMDINDGTECISTWTESNISMGKD